MGKKYVMSAFVKVSVVPEAVNCGISFFFGVLWEVKMTYIIPKNIY